MTGHRSFNNLIRPFSAERRARVVEKASMLHEEMTLEELRKSLEVSQGTLAALMAVGQPAVAKLEKRPDMHVSNLRRYVEALGGKLEIAAHFAGTKVVITSVGEPAEPD